MKPGGPGGGRKPTTSMHVPVRRRLAPAPGDVQVGEALGDAGAVVDRQVGATVRHVEPRRTPRRLHPVDHAADPVALPEHVAQVEVAVQERRLVRRRVAAEDRERLLPRAGMARPLRHDVLRRPRPRLVVARRSGRDDGVDRDEQVGELSRGRPRRPGRGRPGPAAGSSGGRGVPPSTRRRRGPGWWARARRCRRARRWISLSRLVNPAPWVRHGSLTIEPEHGPTTVLRRDGDHGRRPATLERLRGDQRAAQGGGCPDQASPELGLARCPTVGHGQCGCHASWSAVRAVTAAGSVPLARSARLTRSKTSRRELRAAIQTSCRTSALSL